MIKEEVWKFLCRFTNLKLWIIIPKQLFAVCHLTTFRKKKKKKKSSFFRCLVAQLNFAVLMILKGPCLWAMFGLKVQKQKKNYIPALIYAA